ncbi:MAG: Asp-tRNA(Asn)/Glu-tRNA(Gln) amidotransferase subunit GatC [Thermotogota bacterium]
MIKVDSVLIHRLEQLAKIELDINEREKLRLEIIQALEFVDQLVDSENCPSISIIRSVMNPEKLREDSSEKSLFAFFDNVSERIEDYVVVSKG